MATRFTADGRRVFTAVGREFMGVQYPKYVKAVEDLYKKTGKPITAEDIAMIVENGNYKKAPLIILKKTDESKRTIRRSNKSV